MRRGLGRRVVGRELVPEDNMNEEEEEEGEGE